MEPENEEFNRLMGLLDWTQAETARQLQLTTGGVSQMANGHIKPRPIYLRVMRDQLREIGAEGRVSVPAWAVALLNDLLLVDPAAKDSAVEAARKVVQAFPKRSNWQNFANLAGGLSDLKPVEGASSEASFAAEQPPKYKSEKLPDSEKLGEAMLGRKKKGKA